MKTQDEIEQEIARLMDLRTKSKGLGKLLTTAYIRALSWVQTGDSDFTLEARPVGTVGYKGDDREDY